MCPRPGRRPGASPSKAHRADTHIYLFVTNSSQRLGVVHVVYIMASRPGGALYTGRTGNLRQRVQAHRANLSVHIAKYNIHTLVWFEVHSDFDTSLQRERQIKRWRRAWKCALITQTNPDWKDISACIPF